MSLLFPSVIWAVLTALYYLYQLEPRIVEFKDMRGWTFLEEQSAVSKVSPLSTQKDHHSKIPPFFYKYIFWQELWRVADLWLIALGNNMNHLFIIFFIILDTPFTYAYCLSFWNKWSFGAMVFLYGWHNVLLSWKGPVSFIMSGQWQWQGRQQQFLLATLLLLPSFLHSHCPIALRLSCSIQELALYTGQLLILEDQTSFSTVNSLLWNYGMQN